MLNLVVQHVRDTPDLAHDGSHPVTWSKQL